MNFNSRSAQTQQALNFWMTAIQTDQTSRSVFPLRFEEPYNQYSSYTLIWNLRYLKNTKLLQACITPVDYDKLPMKIEEQYVRNKVMQLISRLQVVCFGVKIIILDDFSITITANHYLIQNLNRSQMKSIINLIGDKSRNALRELFRLTTDGFNSSHCNQNKLLLSKQSPPLGEALQSLLHQFNNLSTEEENPKSQHFKKWIQTSNFKAQLAVIAQRAQQKDKARRMASQETYPSLYQGGLIKETVQIKQWLSLSQEEKQSKKRANVQYIIIDKKKCPKELKDDQRHIMVLMHKCQCRIQMSLNEYSFSDRNGRGPEIRQLVFKTVYKRQRIDGEPEQTQEDFEQTDAKLSRSENQKAFIEFLKTTRAMVDCLPTFYTRNKQEEAKDDQQDYEQSTIKKLEQDTISDYQPETLKEVLQKKRKTKPFGIRERLNTLQKIARGLYELEKLGLCHRSLTPQHVMLNASREEVKFIGLGSVHNYRGFEGKHFEAKHNEVYANSDKYIPQPFRNKFDKNAKSFDVYSFGVIMQEVLGYQRIYFKGIKNLLNFISKACQSPNPDDRPDSTTLYQLLKGFSCSHYFADASIQKN